MNIKTTESELEILQVLWQKGNCTVRQVHEELSKNKESGYTTTLKLMQIMHDKGLVTRDSSAKTHIYSAAVSEKHTQKSAVEKMINTLFKGSAADLVMQALGHHKASKEEIDEIKAYLQKFDK
ncbi:BlaI/MecI/CopY family transcriptional regulator [Mucilaginibacter sp. CSA2-8R]|uniref:BlaI/MecI/CopY family transcriptional regulator n=1 Tax=Mucilaginibacter sp. CSA2-8R TaxID=3141542 RepID=UPI00315DBFD1